MTMIRLSNGERISRKLFDGRVDRAKAIVMKRQRDEIGRNVCTKCGDNEDWPVDPAHIESVADCIKNGHPEKAYDTNNIIPAGRKCHQIMDKLNLKFGI
jgi:hypothetical protein